MWMGFVPTWVRRRHRLWKLDVVAAPRNLTKEKGRKGIVDTVTQGSVFLLVEVSQDFASTYLCKVVLPHGCDMENFPSIDKTRLTYIT